MKHNSWRCRTTMDYEIPSSRTSLRIRLYGMGHSFESKSIGLPELTWSLAFLQPERKSLNQLVTLLLSTVLSQIFLAASKTLWPSSNPLSISFLIRLHCRFICPAFKSHSRSKAMHKMSAHQWYYQPEQVLVLYNQEMIFFILIIFVNYILSFSLVGLWTIRVKSSGA